MIGYAVSLDGIDDYIELPNQAYFEKGTDKLNLSFWEKHEYNDLDNFTIFHAHSSLGTLLQVQLPSAQGNLNLLTGSGSLDQTTTINTSIPQNNWNYWVLQSDLSTGISEIFLNGELEEEYFGITKPFDSFAETFRIGTNYDYSESWSGVIDEVRISTLIKSSERVKAAFENQKPDSSFITVGIVTGPSIILSSEKLQAFKDKAFPTWLNNFPHPLVKEIFQLLVFLLGLV